MCSHLHLTFLQIGIIYRIILAQVAAAAAASSQLTTIFLVEIAISYNLYLFADQFDVMSLAETIYVTVLSQLDNHVPDLSNSDRSTMKMT